MSKSEGEPPKVAAKFLGAEMCAARYGFSKRHWLRLVDSGKAPQPVRFNRLVRWAEAALDEWDCCGNEPVRTPRSKGGA